MRSRLCWKMPHCDTPSFFLGVLSLAHIELSGTTCGLEFNSLMLSNTVIFFLSRNINRHMICYELEPEMDTDLRDRKND